MGRTYVVWYKAHVTDTGIHWHSSLLPLLFLNVYLTVQFLFRVIDLVQKLQHYPQESEGKDSSSRSRDWQPEWQEQPWTGGQKTTWAWFCRLMVEDIEQSTHVLWPPISYLPTYHSPRKYWEPKAIIITHVDKSVKWYLSISRQKLIQNNFLFVNNVPFLFKGAMFFLI